MNPATGFLQLALTQRAASTSALPPDFANHDDSDGFRVVVEEFDYVNMRGAIDRVAANAYAGGLADAF